MFQVRTFLKLLKILVNAAASASASIPAAAAPSPQRRLSFPESLRPLASLYSRCLHARRGDKARAGDCNKGLKKHWTPPSYVRRFIPSTCMEDHAQFGFQFTPSKQERMSGEMGDSAANVHCGNPESFHVADGSKIGHPPRRRVQPAIPAVRW